MRVFLAGATGVIGRRLLPRLVSAGHDVTAMTRSPQSSDGLRAAGATPVVADVFDVDRLGEVMATARTEVVVHQLTSLPKKIDPKHLDVQLADNDRIRTLGTKNLVAAALACGVRRVVSQSIAFAYTPDGDGLKVETDPLFLDAPKPFMRTVHAVRDLEAATLAVEGAVLRYGFFYGPGSAYARDGSFAEGLVCRCIPIVGRGAGVFSFIHVDDAAEATVRVIEQGATGVFNIVDDEPAPAATWMPLMAERLGAKPPRRIPAWVGRLGGGPYAVYLMNEQRGASNRKARTELGWTPRYPTWREGLAT